MHLLIASAAATAWFPVPAHHQPHPLWLHQRAAMPYAPFYTYDPWDALASPFGSSLSSATRYHSGLLSGFADPVALMSLLVGDHSTASELSYSSIRKDSATEL